MSRRLTDFYKHYLKHSQKPRKKRSGYVLIAVIFVIVLTIVLLFPKHVDQGYFMEKELYFVVANVDVEHNSESREIENIVKYGGAGVIADIGEYKNVSIIFVYNDKNDAEKILSSSKSIFTNAQVISVKSKKISKILQTKIQEVPYLEKTIKFIYDSKMKLSSLLFDYEKGDISFNELYNNVYSFNEKIKEYMDSLKNHEKINTCLNALSVSANSFLDSSIVGEYSTKGLKKLCVNCFISEVELKNIVIKLFS